MSTGGEFMRPGGVLLWSNLSMSVECCTVPTPTHSCIHMVSWGKLGCLCSASGACDKLGRHVGSLRAALVTPAGQSTPPGLFLYTVLYYTVIHNVVHCWLHLSSHCWLQLQMPALQWRAFGLSSYFDLLGPSRQP